MEATMIGTRLRLKLSILFFVFLCTTQSFAMQTTGRIQGTIKDSTGAVVPEASLTLKNAKTGAERQTKTDEVGRYTFLQVEAGEYQLSVENTGFKKYVQVGIILLLNQVAEVNISLDIGETSEAVTIEADASQVETNSTQLGNVVNERAVTGLPLSSRDTYQLLQLQAGVQSQIGSD